MIIKKGTLLFNDNETYRFDVDTTLQEIKQTFSEDGFSERDYYDFIWGNYVGTIINIVFHKNSKHLVDEGLVKLKGKEYTFEELDKTKETWENMASEVLVEEDLIKADQEIKKRLDLMKIFLDKKE
jgi:hypothetical protein